MHFLMSKSELKTLKDLSYGFNHIPNSVCDVEDLKAEAVKWVKELKEHDDKRDLKRDDSIGEWGGYRINDLEIEAGYEQNDNDGMIKWIKHFFNLTEEDLK